MSKVFTKSVKSTKVVKSVTKFENPYRVGGSYWALTEILSKSLGKMMTVESIIKTYGQTIGAEGFKAFKSKDARNENGKDWQGRILQNLNVLMRVKDYGKPLVDACLELRKGKREKGISFGLFKAR